MEPNAKINLMAQITKHPLLYQINARPAARTGAVIGRHATRGDVADSFLEELATTASNGFGFSAPGKREKVGPRFQGPRPSCATPPAEFVSSITRAPLRPEAQA